MKPVIRNTLAVLSGIVAGSVINMGLISISSFVIPPPEGADATTMEGLREAMHLFGPEHFLFPFLAHALGTFAGAAVAAFMAISHKMRTAMIVGCFFLLGGIINAYLLPAPGWFIAVDLILAYIPFAWAGARLVSVS